MTRRNLLAALLILLVIALTLRSVLHETHLDEQYGMTRIRLTDQTLYVKSRRCTNGCDAGLWLSRSSDRCQAPDAAADYFVSSGQLLFARQGNTLAVIGGPNTVVASPAAKWINLKLVSSFSPEANSMPLQAIVVGEHIPTRNVPTEQIALDFCVRAFGHNWDWF